MNILFLSLDYPNKYRASFEFVKNLVEEIANQGHHCYVIAPYNVTHEKRLWHGLEKVRKPCGGSITIARPNTMTFSNMKIGKIMLTNVMRKMAINRALRKMNFKPDAAYGHFWSCGAELFPYAKKNRIPLFVASGESTIDMNFVDVSNLEQFSNYVSGVVCVSGKNRDESIRLKLTTKEKCEVFPNAINSNLFCKKDKIECRKKLKIPNEAFVVAFVGWFDERKGVNRLADAINNVPDVKSIFIGKGVLNPTCEGVLFKGFIPHDEVPDYLNAADVFVLPTRHEGCCNAVIEAMACGLPIVSSNRSFNWDVLDQTNSIMVDPDNIEEIADAIRILRDNPEKREDLSKGALAKAEELTIEKRAEGIVSFIENKMKN